MKKTVLLFLMLFSVLIMYAQQKPPLQRTTGAQVVSDRALKVNQYFGVPVGATPYFPAFVADSNKNGALFYKTTDSSLYVYNSGCTCWVKYKPGAIDESRFIKNQNIIDEIKTARIRGSFIVNGPLFHSIIPHNYIDANGVTASSLNTDSTNAVSVTLHQNQIFFKEGVTTVLGIQGVSTGNHISSGSVTTQFDDTVRSFRVPVNGLDITNKDYVDGAITASGLAFSEGLTKSGSNVKWGSTTPLTGDVNINPAANKIEFKGSNIDQSVNFSVDNRSGGASISLITDKNNPSHVGQAYLYLQSAGGVPTQISMEVIDDTNNAKTRGFYIDNNPLNPILIHETIGNNGIAYETDNSTNGKLNPLWIADWASVKAYADSVSAGGGTLTSITPGIGFTSHTPITSSGTMDVDTVHIRGGLLTVANPTYTGKLAGSRQIVGDSTRNISITFVGTSITTAKGYGGVTEVDSGYVAKFARLKGIKTINYGLSGRTVQQVTVGDSSMYSKRFNIPTYTAGSYIAYEALIDAVKDSTVFNVATYTTQLGAVVDAAIAAGYPANKILIFNGAYFNPPAYPTYPNIEARHDQYATAAQSVATAKGTLFYDAYYTFKTAWTVTPTLLEAALLHPTNSGHTLIASELNTFLSGISAINLSDQPSKIIGGQLVYGNQTVNGNSEIGGDQTIYNNQVVGGRVTMGDLTITNTLPVLAPNSTTPIATRGTNGILYSRALSKPDLQYTIGTNSTSGTLDFNDATNYIQGYGPTLLRGSTASNPPISGSTAFWMPYNAEHGTSKDGSGNIRQWAYAYGDATSLAVGDFFRWRFSGTWSSWKHFVQTNAVLPANGQIPIGNGADFTTANITGTANQITVTNGSGTIGLSIPSSPVFTTPVLGTPTSVTLTNATGLPLTTGVTGILPIANGGTGSASQNFVDLTTAQATIAGNKGWTGTQTITKTALGVTTTDAALLSNTTAASNNAQQISPAIHFQGAGWGTTGSASQSVDARISLLPTQGTNPGSQIVFEFARNGGAYSNQGNIGNTGIATFGSFKASVNAIATTSTDGVMLTNSTLATSGVPVQYTTRINQSGSVWNTTATAAANQFNFAQEGRGVSGTTPTASLFWMSSLVTGTTPSFTDRMSLDNSGNLTMITGTVILHGYTVATLPTGVTGMTAYVTDALTPTFGNTLVGGGAVVAKAFYNGTNWINE